MDFLGIFLGVLGVAGTVGAGSAVFYANRSRSIISLLKEENDALNTTNNRLEKDLIVAETKRVAANNEAQIWRDNVTQAPSIKELTTEMTRQNTQVIDSLGNVAKELSSLAKAIRKGQK